MNKTARPVLRMILLVLCLMFISPMTTYAAKEEEGTQEEPKDTTSPTLIASISNGYFTVTGYDAESGIGAFYVNGYEYTDFTENMITFRLQQFDAGYEYFKVRVRDVAGNLSNVYKIKNPYYDDDPDDNDDKGLSQLPADAEKSDPMHALGRVLNHAKTDAYGNLTVSTVETGGEEIIPGKDFYTIKTDTGKVFYLIIDRTGDDEQVYFLTEISENDLLNVVSDEKEVLPKNSTATEGGFVSMGTASSSESSASRVVAADNPERNTKPVIKTNTTFLVLIGIVSAVAFVVIILVRKMQRNRRESDSDDDDDEDDEDDDEDDKDDDEDEDEDDVADTIDD